MFAIASVTLLIGLTGFFTRALYPLVPVLLVATGLAALVERRMLKTRLAAIRTRRVLPLAVGRGAHFTSVVVLKNTGTHALRGQLRDLLPDVAEPRYLVTEFELAPGAELQLPLKLLIPVRGKYSFGPVWLRVCGPLHLLEVQTALPLPGELKVLPATALSDDALEKNERAEIQLLEKASHSRLRGDGLEFESLSEFRDGDDPRRIDWRTSARCRFPVVRRFTVEQHRDVMIVVDCGRLMGIAADSGTKLDRAVDAALMLSRVALDKGDRCGLALFDDRVQGFLPPLSGAQAHKTFLDCLYNAQSRMKESNFASIFQVLQARQVKRSLVVVLSDLVDADTSEQFRMALLALARRHVVLFAALRTPLLSGLLKKPIGGMDEMMEHGVAVRLLRAREKALHSLDHTGVHIIDVEPNQLTVPVINRYIALRQQNLL